MPEFLTVKALMAALSAGSNDLASAAIVVIPLGLLAAAELYRAR